MINTILISSLRPSFRSGNNYANVWRWRGGGERKGREEGDREGGREKRKREGVAIGGKGGWGGNRDGGRGMGWGGVKMVNRGRVKIS